MIKTATVFYVECDICGNKFTIDYGVEYFEDKGLATDQIVDYDWLIEGSKTFCEFCATERKPPAGRSV